MESIKRSGHEKMAAVNGLFHDLWESLISKCANCRVVFQEDRKGWLVCLAVLVITIIRSGITYSFGIFIVELQAEFKAPMLEQSKLQL